MKRKNSSNIRIENKFSESVWKKEEEKFKKAVATVKIPNQNLDKVDGIHFKKEIDFNEIPDIGGCYWIWTNEPVRDRFHKNKTPDKINNGEIIYNGIAKDNVRERVKCHLFAEEKAKWSAISLDIYFSKPRSHQKKVFSLTGKTPYVETNLKTLVPIREKKLISKLFLSNKEKDFIGANNFPTYYFRNGINIFDEKHNRFIFKIYFIAGLESLYLEYIEKKWRERFGLPKLCTYSSGR